MPTDEVVFLNPKTCGIYKNGGVRYKTDHSTGRRTAEIDNELIEDVDKYLAGGMPEGSAKIALSDIVQRQVLVPTYYDERYQLRIKKLLREERLQGITLGQMQDQHLIRIRGGHGSPSNDQRSGTIPTSRCQISAAFA